MFFSELISLLEVFESQMLIFRIGHLNVASQLRANLKKNTPADINRNITINDFYALMNFIPFDTDFPVLQKLRDSYCKYRAREVYHTLVTPPITPIVKILGLLFSSKLLDASPELIDYLLERHAECKNNKHPQENRDADLNYFYYFICRLRQHDALQSDTLQLLFIQVFRKKDNETLHILIEIIKKCENAIKLQKEDYLNLILKLTAKQIRKLATIINFRTLPQPFNLKLFRDALEFVQHKLVAAPERKEPLKKDEGLQIVHVALLKDAKHEAKYLYSLGRKVFWHTNNNTGSTYVISERIPEKKISDFTSKQLANIPLHTRLTILTKLLQQVASLHANFRIYGSNILENCFVDFANTTICLQGFTKTKKWDYKIFQHHPVYAVDNSKQYSDDIHGLGMVALRLFPEIISVDVDQQPLFTTAQYTPQNLAIYRLFKELLKCEHGVKGCENLATFSQEILEKFNELSHAVIQQITASSLAFDKRKNFFTMRGSW